MSVAHELAWSAGFFDGEGYVTIGKRKTRYKDKIYQGHYLRIGINHVAIEPLLEMQRLFGGKIEKQPAHSVKGRRKPRHRWTCSCSQAAEGLKKMMPYFKNKQKAAEIGLELQNTMQPNKTELSESLIVFRSLLKQKLQQLNSLD